MRNKKIKGLLVPVIILSLVIVNFVFTKGEIEVKIYSESTAVAKEAVREYTIQHSLDVSYLQITGQPEIVLVLDRSNSMLEEGFDGLPVAQTVWDSVNDFLDRYYAEYPTGQVAIVSFGTNAVKNDNWKYYDNITDAKNEVAAIYSYSYGEEAVYEYVWQNNHWLKTFVGNEFTFYWHNWQHENGGTNIKEGFEYAETTIWHKDKGREPIEMMPNSVVLFSDGVATHGGIKSEEDLLYPIVHNSNTLSAISASNSLGDVANIVTVGYFEGVPDPAVIELARDTLNSTNNGGFFEAGQLVDVEPVFQAALDSIKYVGSDSVLREVVSSDFEVEPTSVAPQDGLSISYLKSGETVLEWNLGSLKPEMYDFTYDIKVKSSSYPTGKENVLVNESSVLSYEDLLGNLVEKELDSIYVDIDPLEGMPYMTLDVAQVGSVDGGYLVGDEIQLIHELSYSNNDLFMFDELMINELIKVSILDLENNLSLEDTSWTYDRVNNTMSKDIGLRVNKVDFGNYLAWSDSYELTFEAIMPGEYQFIHELDYYQVDNNGDAFPGYFEDNMNTVYVAESQVNLAFEDQNGMPVQGVEIDILLMDTMEVVVEGLVSDVDGYLVYEGLPTNAYYVQTSAPDGYVYSGIDATSKGITTIPVYLDYGNPVYYHGFDYIDMDIQGISVQTVNNETSYISNERETPIDAIITFEPLVAMKNLQLVVQDNFGDSFELDSFFVLEEVLNDQGQKINGFTFNNTTHTLEYSENEGTLLAGQYTAYGYFDYPEAINEVNDRSFINVDTVRFTDGGTDVVIEYTGVYSDGLLISLDEVPPVIVATYDAVTVPLEPKDVEVSIIDSQLEVVEYYVLQGEYTEEEALDFINVNGLSVGSGLKDIVINSPSDVEGMFVVQPEEDETSNGYFTGSGEYTIIAVDALGNISVEVISVTVIAELPDNI